MDLYLENTILECDTPAVYSLHAEDGYAKEEVSYERFRLMQFDTGYMLYVIGVFRYMDFGEQVSLKIYREDEVMLEFRNMEIITKDKENGYRFYCKTDDARLADGWLLKDSEKFHVVENNAGEYSIASENLDAIYEKYFSTKAENAVLLERRKMRRRQDISSSTNVGKNILSGLDSMIGLYAVKLEIKKMIAVEAQKEFRERIGMENTPNDMLFLGNPGTGKTTVARYLTEILYKMGKIRENKCLEISGHDLMGGYIGQTASTVEKYLREARGGVLFIDEAYSLLDGSDSFASDAITKLLGALTKSNRDFVCILAGYENEMNELMKFNAGFESRIATKLYFENYTVDELGEIFCSLIKSYGYRVEKETLAMILQYFESVKDAPKFSNGRFVRNLFEKMEEEHCRYFNGSEEEADTFRNSDLTDEIKQELAIGII